MIYKDYNIPVLEDTDIADLNDYTNLFAEAMKVQIDKFGNALIYKGTIDTLVNLQNNKEKIAGNIYNVTSENKNYICNRY